MRLSGSLRFPWRCFSKLIRELRGGCLLNKVTDRREQARIVIADPFLPVSFHVGENAKFILKGRLTFASFQGLREIIYLNLARDSSLIIDGNFNLGPGCRIDVARGGQLYIGGQRVESLSGVTERSRIMVRERVHIGADLVCSWGAFITDSDWHDMAGHRSTEETVIGDHVWITPNCSILKGSRIGNGCILASGSVTHRASFPDGCLVGGVPARVLAANRKWNRDMAINPKPALAGITDREAPWLPTSSIE